MSIYSVSEDEVSKFNSGTCFFKNGSVSYEAAMRVLIESSDLKIFEEVVISRLKGVLKGKKIDFFVLGYAFAMSEHERVGLCILDLEKKELEELMIKAEKMIAERRGAVVETSRGCNNSTLIDW